MPVLLTSAPAICTLISDGREKLMNEEAVGRINFDHPETGFMGAPGCALGYGEAHESCIDTGEATPSS